MKIMDEYKELIMKQTNHTKQQQWNRKKIKNYSRHKIFVKYKFIPGILLFFF